MAARIKASLFVVCAVILFLFSSCAEEKQAVIVPAQPQQAADGADQQQGASDAGSGLSPAAEKFSGFLSKREANPFTVTYRSKMVAPPLIYNAEEIWHYAGREKMRVAITIEGVEMRTYLMGDAVTACTRAGEGWDCAASETGATTKAEREAENDLTGSSVAYIGKETHAGKATECFTVDTPDSSIELKYCFTDEGVPLYLSLEGSEGGKALLYEREATAFSEGADESDFEIP